MERKWLLINRCYTPAQVELWLVDPVATEPTQGTPSIAGTLVKTWDWDRTNDNLEDLATEWAEGMMLRITTWGRKDAGTAIFTVEPTPLCKAIIV